MSFKTKKQEVINFSKRNWKAITGTLLLGVGTTAVIAKVKKDKENDDVIINIEDGRIVISDGTIDNTAKHLENSGVWDDKSFQLKEEDYNKAKEVLLENGISLDKEEGYVKYLVYKAE